VKCLESSYWVNYKEKGETIMEKTLVLIKPDAVEKKLVGRILGMYEENGLMIENIYMKHVDETLLSKHYEEHIGRDFYPSLVEFMSSAPIFAVLVSGKRAVEKVRHINGATNPKNASPNTIRALFGTDVQRNCVHGSASVEEAEREVTIWFG